MKRGIGLALAILLVISLAASACATAAPSPTSVPSAATKTGEITKPSTEATKAPETAKPSAEPTRAPEATKPAETAKPAAAKPPIKIGYLAPLTGTSARMGAEIRDGFAMYIEEKGGSLAGRKIELIVEDDEMNPQAGLTKAKKLVERDNVQMLAGIVSSAVAYALADYVKAQKIPLLITNAGADDLTKQRFSPYIFRNSFSNSQMAYPLGEWAYKQGYRKAAVVSTDYAAGYEYVGGFAKAFTDSGGRITQEQYPALGAPDPAPFITTISPDADVTFVFQLGGDAMRFIPAYEQYGVKKRIPMLAYASVVEGWLVAQQGDAALGILGAAPWTSTIDTPANKAFVAAYQKKLNVQPTFGVAIAYEGAKMVEKALQAIDGNIEDREAFIKALEKVEIPDSPRGPVKFDQYHNAIVNVYMTEIKKVDGKLVNSVIDTYKDVSQFWKWSPEEYMKMPNYADLKGKWVK